MTRFVVVLGLVCVGCRGAPVQRVPSRPGVIALVREDIATVRLLEKHSRGDRKALSEFIDKIGEYEHVRKD